MEYIAILLFGLAVYATVYKMSRYVDRANPKALKSPKGGGDGVVLTRSQKK